VRTAILLVLADEAMHGYQIMQAISDRTGGAWRASPGAVYPTIAQLEDEGLVTTREEGGRRSVTLTSEGRTYVEERSARLGDPFAEFADRPTGPDLREPLHELQAAARQILSSGSAAQVEAASQVLARARRSLYLILAGEPEETAE
jgi:DNA-binding PadR family transcriptional regulator